MQKAQAIFVAFALMGGAGMATAQDHNPAVKDSAPAHVGHAAEGANSFTEDQAKGRLTKAGYSNIGPLKKDDKGHWVGGAMKNGKKVNVALDYKGNVTVQPHHK